MKTKKNKVKVGFYTGLLMITCLTMKVLVAGEGASKQKIHLQKNAKGINVEVEFEPDPETLVEVLVSENLKDWRVEKVFLGSDGQILWPDPDNEGASRRFYKFAQTPLDEASERDSDGDYLRDVFELEMDMDPMVSNEVEVTSVSVSKPAIAAGALESEPHQTEVTLEVSPAGSYPVKVWLEGGDGFGVASKQHSVGGELQQYGPAKIVWNDKVCIAGSGVPGESAIEVMTDSDGVATVLLTSSNEIDETCIVHARVGTVRVDTSQAQSLPVVFEKGRMQFDLPTPLLGGTTSTATITRTYKGEPLVGHDVVMFVNQVRINGLPQVFDSANPDKLSGYATSQDEVRQSTDENGQVIIDWQVADTEGLEYMEMKAEDLQVFGE